MAFYFLRWLVPRDSLSDDRLGKNMCRDSFGGL